MAAQLIAFGRVPVVTPGTPVQIPIPAGLAPATVHALSISALKGNVGAIYIGNAQTMVRASYVGVLQVLPIPTANAIPSFSMTVTMGANAIPVNQLWIDADTAGDGVLVSGILA